MRDLLAREVVGALISSYWAHGRLEVPEIKWIRTNNYKFHTFRSVHFYPGLSARPSFRFSEGLVPRLTLHHEYNSSLLIGLLELSPFEVSGYIFDEILSEVVCLL